MSFLSAGLNWNSGTMKKAAGETVTYYRGSQAITLTAVVGQTIFEEFETGGELRAQAKTVDFVVTPADLKLDGFAVEPQKGDQIKRSDGEVYDVMTGTGSVPWQWSDGRKTHYRIHTVRRRVQS